MKRMAIALILLLSSSALLGQTFQIMADQKPKPRLEVDIGMVQVRTHNANYRIAYLPFLAPLPYSYPRTTMEVPNPLELTATSIPQRPHTRPPEAVVTVGRR